MKKSVIRITCFIIILGFTLGYVNKIFKLKDSDGIYGLTKFYELEDDTVDVLILGSSHAFEDFNTGTLWDEYGMASYILAGSLQPMWNTYYYLKEALKTQRPELIILEGYMTGCNKEFSGDAQIIKNNFGLRWSADKVNAIKTSSPEEEWEEFLLGYTRYHTRYSYLSDADFLSNQNDKMYDDWKGFGCNMITESRSVMDVAGIMDREALHEKTEKYYRAVIELAQEKDIPIVVVVSPYAGINEHEQQIFNTASDIAAEYGVEFVNCNLLLEEIGIDYSTDASDGAHLNYRGNQKYSKFIGGYLKDNYTISDRRNDSDYASWQRNADYVRQMIADEILKESYNVNQVAEMLNNPNYWVFISVDGNCDTNDANLQYFFLTVGIYQGKASGIWYKNADGVVWYSTMKDAEQYVRTSAHDFCMRRYSDGSGSYKNSIIIDNAQYTGVENGVNIIVYDTVTEKIADIMGIDMDDGYKLFR